MEKAFENKHKIIENHWKSRSNLAKKPWSLEEDKSLIDLVHKFGAKRWATIANYLPGRVGKQCRERWHNHLNPDVKKDAWTTEEDMLIFTYHEKLGNQWAEISKYLPGRTDNAIKNRFYSTMRKIQRQKLRKDGQENNFPIQSHNGVGKLANLAFQPLCKVKMGDDLAVPQDHSTAMNHINILIGLFESMSQDISVIQSHSNHKKMSESYASSDSSPTPATRARKRKLSLEQSVPSGEVPRPKRKTKKLKREHNQESNQCNGLDWFEGKHSVCDTEFDESCLDLCVTGQQIASLPYDSTGLFDGEEILGLKLEMDTKQGILEYFTLDEIDGGISQITPTKSFWEFFASPTTKEKHTSFFSPSITPKSGLLTLNEKDFSSIVFSPHSVKMLLEF